MPSWRSEKRWLNLPLAVCAVRLVSVVSDGQIAECGTHDELLSRCDRIASIVLQSLVDDIVRVPSSENYYRVVNSSAIETCFACTIRPNGLYAALVSRQITRDANAIDADRPIEENETNNHIGEIDFGQHGGQGGHSGQGGGRGGGRRGHGVGRGGRGGGGRGRGRGRGRMVAQVLGITEDEARALIERCASPSTSNTDGL